jgi:hypothetical protein
MQKLVEKQQKKVEQHQQQIASKQNLINYNKTEIKAEKTNELVLSQKEPSNLIIIINLKFKILNIMLNRV